MVEGTSGRALVLGGSRKVTLVVIEMEHLGDYLSAMGCWWYLVPMILGWTTGCYCHLSPLCEDRIQLTVGMGQDLAHLL